MLIDKFTKRDARKPIRLDTRLFAILTLMVAQAACATFFVGDVLKDYRTVGFNAHTTYEAIAVVALVFGVLFGAVELWWTRWRWLSAESALEQTRTAFSEMIAERFAHWSLTAAESEVALLTLKGFDASEIATLRNTADGTVRVQLAKVYAKSGLNNRGQFVSSFIDDLLDSPAHRDTFANLP